LEMISQLYIFYYSIIILEYFKYNNNNNDKMSVYNFFANINRDK
jgi:hypothetical protein